MKMNFKRLRVSKRKLQYGSISVLLTVVFIACVLLVNMGVTYLDNRYTLRLDMSESGLYEISEQTEVMLKSLKEPVTAYILMSEDDAKNSSGYSQAAELLRRYESLSGGNFHLEFVDIYKNPTFIQKYQENQTVSTGSFIIESSKRFKVASLTDLYEIATDSTTETQYASGFNADQSFASALHYVTTDELLSCVQIVGHDEYYDESFTAIFTANNYTVTQVNLSMADIPEDTALVLIGSPSTDYTAEEITKLDTYLSEQSGNAMVFTDVTSPSLEKLERYFTEWGVEYLSAMVIDPDRSISNTGNAAILPTIQATDLTENFSYSSNTVLPMVYCRGLGKLWENRSSRTVTEILTSSSASYGKIYSDVSKLETVEKAEGDVDGPLPLVLLSEQVKYDNTTPLISRVLFFSTTGAAVSTYLDTSTYANKAFITASLNYMNPSVDAVSIEPRDLTSTTLSMDTTQANVAMFILVGIIPLIIFAFGFVIWHKRRNM